MSTLSNTLQVTGALNERVLETVDNAQYNITVKNCHPRATLRHVWVWLTLSRENGKPFERVRLHQHEVGFRDLGPKESDTKTVTVETRGADGYEGDYVINVQSDYMLEDRGWECDVVRFKVDKD